VIVTPILLFQQASRCGASASRRYDGRAAALFDMPDEFVATISLVRNGIPRFVIGQAARGLANIVFLSRSNGQFEWAALVVDRQVKHDLNPPRDRPRASSPPFFWIALAAGWWARMVVESSMRHSRSGSCQTSKNATPHPPFAQPIEPLQGQVPFSESFGKVAPWSPRPRDPTHGFVEQPIVFGCTSGVARFAGPQVLDLHPLFVRDLVSPHNLGSSLNRKCDKVS
jgi:hypothetical protein